MNHLSHAVRTAQLAGVRPAAASQLVRRFGGACQGTLTAYTGSTRDRGGRDYDWGTQRGSQSFYAHEFQNLWNAAGFSTGLVLSIWLMRTYPELGREKSTRTVQDGSGEGREQEVDRSTEEWFVNMLASAYHKAKRVHRVLDRLVHPPLLMDVIRMRMHHEPTGCFSISRNAPVLPPGAQSLASQLAIDRTPSSYLSSRSNDGGASVASTLFGGAASSPIAVPAGVGKSGTKKDEGSELSPNMLSALAQFETALDAATPRSENTLGVLSSKARRDEEAVSLFSEASAHGYAKAQYNLGVCYGSGRGVTKDLTKAVECYREAAQRGHPMAMYNLGVFYAQGNAGCTKDWERAASLFKGAAEKGIAPAQYSLGLCHEHGRGVPVDHTKAAHWYRLAADQGHTGSMHRLAGCYETGRGVGVSGTQAATLYKQAGSGGHLPSLVSLAELHAEGRGGVDRDPVLARKLLMKAAAGGHKGAADRLAELYSEGSNVPPCTVTSSYFSMLARP